MRGSTPSRAALCVMTKRPESIWRGHEHPEWFSHRRWGWRLCHCRDPHPSFTGGSRIENRTMQGWLHRGRQNHPQRLTFWLHSADRSTRLPEGVQRDALPSPHRSGTGVAADLQSRHPDPGPGSATAAATPGPQSLCGSCRLTWKLEVACWLAACYPHYGVSCA